MASTVEIPERPGQLDMDALDGRLNTIAGHLNVQYSLLVDCVIELLTDEASWTGPGIHTPEQYLTWRMGLSPTRARDLVTIARRAAELPVCADAFRHGELSVDQMTAVARRAPWWTDTEICDLARNMTVHQLRTTLNSYPFPDIPRSDEAENAGPGDSATTDDLDEAGDASDQPGDDSSDDPSDDYSDDSGDPANPAGPSADTPRPPQDELWFGFDTNGQFRMELRCDAATGEVIQAALRESRDRQFHNDQPDVTWIDAIRDIAERSLDNITEPSRRDRFRIDIHLDATTGALTNATGWRLPDAIRNHLTCDGLITPTLMTDGIPVSVGRTQRTVPERTRRHVIHRDRGCRIPGCTHNHFLEVHHIIHWLHGGDTNTHNLIALCPHHHRLHHKGKLGITGNADTPNGITVTDATGTPITPSGASPEQPTATPPAPFKPYHHPLGERCDYDYIYFRPPDRDDHQRHFAERFGLPYPNGNN